MAQRIDTNIKLDTERLWTSIHEIAKIGPGKAGGNNRQALTDEDGEARHLFRKWCEDAGLTVGVDQMGNMFATRPGIDPEALPVFVGSHLDTQPTGGRYDGVLGVMAGLEIIRTMNELGLKTHHPITIVNWTNEEGSRFAPPMLASGVFAGVHSLEYGLSRLDANGKSLGQELNRIGWQGDEACGARKAHAYLELHIEQGPLLEDNNCEIGVVTRGQGLWWLEFTLTGRESHTGTTPMASRADATLAMARIIELARSLAMSNQPDALCGVGQIAVTPNSRNVLPEQVVFTVDIRSPNPDLLNALRRELETRARHICDDLDVGCSIEPVGSFEPVKFDMTLAARLEQAADRLGYSHMHLTSGAGHDACWMTRVAPSVMLMCPCEGGLSHSEAESITPDWAAASANVLFLATLETAGIV
ncbi:MAG: Zn-dependent hydrolase [Roseovarius sp.]